MAVLRPIKLVVTNYPEGQTEWLPTDNNPEDASAGTRELPFGRELYIEAEDFRVEGVNKKWFRLAPGRSGSTEVGLHRHVCGPRDGRVGKCQGSPCGIPP